MPVKLTSRLLVLLLLLGVGVLLFKVTEQVFPFVLHAPPPVDDEAWHALKVGTGATVPGSESVNAPGTGSSLLEGLTPPDDGASAAPSTDSTAVTSMSPGAPPDLVLTPQAGAVPSPLQKTTH